MEGRSTSKDTDQISFLSLSVAKKYMTSVALAVCRCQIAHLTMKIIGTEVTVITGMFKWIY